MSGTQLPANSIWTGVTRGEDVTARADAQAYILDARLMPHWAIDWSTTVEATDTLGYKGGIVIAADGAVTTASAGTVVLTNGATNYVERTLAGTVSKNTTGFTTGRLPMYIVVVASHVFTSITDVRTFATQQQNPLESLIVACSDETTDLTTGTAKATFRMPYAFTLVGLPRASLTAAPSGTALTVDINESGTTILSTKLTIDTSETTSTTAATPAVVSDTSLADDAEITVDIDAVGTGAKGLKIALIGRRT